MTSYEEFLSKKQTVDEPSGFDAMPEWLSDCGLFPFQEAIVKWAVKRGRAAIFADTGLGKTRMQVAWAQQVSQYEGNRVLILAPLCVAPQTVAEADKMGIHIRYVREMPAKGDTGIFVTNYEMLDRFELWIEKGFFAGIVLDESSILKNQDGKTRTRIIETCSKIPYRLSCTATPSPNDFMELGNQAEFLGVMTMVEMLAMFFVHDGGETSKWRLKGHGRTKFWEWMSHWAVFVRKPSDLGFEDTGYDLPPLQVTERLVATTAEIPEADNPKLAQTMSERGKARRLTVADRVKEVADLINADSDQWIVWCNLNDESDQLASSIPGSVEVRGSMSIEQKEKAIEAFTNGQARVIVTKPSITGFGLNWQHCHKMVFVGLNDSYEQLYQAIRRCYRFGQIKPVEVHLVSADLEGSVLENIKRKEKQASDMAESMITHMRAFCSREISHLTREHARYSRDVARGKDWELLLGDCVDVAKEIQDDSVDYSVFSPPFTSLYTYSNSPRDMGNSGSDNEFWIHFRFLIAEMARIMRPGRNVSVHCMNLTLSKQRDGVIGIRDFRGDVIREFQKAGFIYHSEVCIWKDPVVAMQRTKALGLLWKQIKKDSSMSRQGLPDYIVTFRKPGVNSRPVSHTAEQFPVAEWQQLASPCWMDIKQSNTLNRHGAREDDDERHIAPLQLDVIQRCIRLWSIYDDLVFSPFAGIGSEGFVALKMGRRFLGSELKRSYWDLAKLNLESAQRDVMWDVSSFRQTEKSKPLPAAHRAKPTSMDNTKAQLQIEDFIGMKTHEVYDRLLEEGAARS